MLKYALSYLKLGWSLIPLQPGSKEPLISSWKEFQKVPPSTSQVSDWFRQWPNANVGIVTGTVSNLAVVDADGTIGLSSLSTLKLTSVLLSMTGTSGRHLFYQYPKDESLRNSVKKLPGLDVRGEGGYVVAPPSIHPNGTRYRWMSAPNAARVLAQFPKTVFASNVVMSGKQEDKQESWISESLEGMKNGHVHNTLIRVLGRLRNDGYSERDAFTLLSPYALVDGKPYSELEQKIQEIWTRYEAPANKRDFPNSIRRSSSASLTPSFKSQPHLDLGSDQTNLVIHTPTDPNSIQQYSSAQTSMESAGRDYEKTGYHNLDALLSGGLKSSRLFTVAARTGTGKSNFLIGIARTFCEAGKRVLFFSTETPFNEIWDRYKATLANPAEFTKHALSVCDSFSPNLGAIEKALEQTRPDLFVFDHVNHISEEVQEIAAFFQGLNLLRRKFDCCGIVSAQLNRSADWVDQKTGEKILPRISMIKGSGTIEQGSSRVLLLSESRVTQEGTEILGNLDKNDRGPKGVMHFVLRTNPYRMEALK